MRDDAPGAPVGAPPATASRVVLVRHGRSAHATRGRLDADALRRWLADYDRAGLAADDRPPAALQALAAGAGLVVASDLPRAVRSAELLVPGRAFESSPLLRETPLPIPALGGARLPLAAWALVVGVGAGWRRLGRVPAPRAVVEQAAAAAAWLGALARAHGLVVAVTHANVRAHVAAAARAAGWRREPGGGGLAHWSAWTLVVPAAPPAAAPSPVPAAAAHAPVPTSTTAHR